MSLVFDALKQHREPAIAMATPVGTVLPDAERSGHSLSSRGNTPGWLAVVLLSALGAGGSVYLFTDSGKSESGSQSGLTEPPTVVQLPVSVAPERDLALKEDSAQAPTASISLPDSSLKPALAALAAEVAVAPAMTTLAMAPVAAPAQTLDIKTSVIESPRPASVATPVRVSSNNASTVVQPVVALARTSGDTIPVQPVSKQPAAVVEAQALVSSQPLAAATNAEPKTEAVKIPKPVLAESGLAPKDIALIMARFNDAVRNGEYESAKGLLDKVAAGLGADSLVALRMHGFLALKMGELQQAREDYQQVAASLPNDHEANRNLAVIDLQQGNQEQSKKRSMHMLEVYPDDPVFKVLAK